MSIYPPKIDARFAAPQRAGNPAHSDAAGTGAGIVCGSFAGVYLEIDPATKEIRAARYRTNGCGFAIAAAEVLAENLAGRRLTELHGLNRAGLRAEIEAALGEFPAARRHCAEMFYDALEAALRDYRARRLEEFAGEKALICTCFGVSEETIERLIEKTGATEVEEIGALSNAGTGCGACRFLIREMLDLREEVFNP
ncbi:MAG: iron-sulfur cluster assembly scaffold protein [Acidobacteria bacterium]|nr:iron-sulfur cluster assembly scaffold protein [Acidobacteriota bacterium]